MQDPPEFLQQIRESPEDDATRLICADWLEEHGQTARAELIRLQCEIAGLDQFDPERKRLENRELKLFREFKPQWLGDLSSMLRSARFERGFIESVSMTANQFLKHAGVVLDRTAALHVSIQQVSDASAKALASADSLRRVRSLVLHGHRMSPAGWTQLLESSRLAGVERLELNLNVDDDQDSTAGVLRGLATGRCRQGLVELTFMGLHLDHQECMQQFAALEFPQLKKLSLPYARADLMPTLMERPYFSQIESLVLEGNRAGSWRRLEDRSEAGSMLTNLDLSSNDITDREIGWLLATGILANVESFNLERNSVTGRSLADLVMQLPRLRRIQASSIDFRGIRFDSVLSSGGHDLHELMIPKSTGLSCDGLAALITQLSPEKLDVSDCELEDRDIVPVLNSDKIRRLRYLDLAGNALSDQTAYAIVASETLRSLRYLSMRSTQISDEAKRDLRKTFGPGVCTFSRG